MAVRVGTSGWQYDDWDGLLYPDDLPKTRWLSWFADRFAAVEVNNTFYRLPQAKTFKGWVEATPDDFRIAFKASRFLTHVKRLNDPEEPVERLLDASEPLGERRGPVLLQLPPDFTIDLDRLDATLSAFAGRVQVAVELRHDSWFTDETAAVLTEHEAALCLADRDSRLLTPVWRTASWTYLRLHAGRGSPTPCYGRTALDSRAAMLAEQWEDAWVFFNNDTNGCAVRDAVWFARRAQAHGLDTTRVPSIAEAAVKR